MRGHKKSVEGRIVPRRMAGPEVHYFEPLPKSEVAAAAMVASPPQCRQDNNVRHPWRPMEGREWPGKKLMETHAKTATSNHSSS